MLHLFLITETPEQTEQRLKVLESLADGLTSQGSYHIAAMKYTQTGNKIKVKEMYCLVSSFVARE